MSIFFLTGISLDNNIYVVRAVAGFEVERVYRNLFKILKIKRKR